MSSHFVLGGLRVATHLAAAPSKTLRVQRDPAGQAGHALARPSWRSSSTSNFCCSILFQVVMFVFHRPRVLSTGTFYTKTRCSTRMGISATFQHHNSNFGANIHASKCTFFQGYHSLESSPAASQHLVTVMTPSPLH